MELNAKSFLFPVFASCLDLVKSGVICPSDSGVSLFTYASHPSLSDVARVSWRDT